MNAVRSARLRWAALLTLLAAAAGLAILGDKTPAGETAAKVSRAAAPPATAPVPMNARKALTPGLPPEPLENLTNRRSLARPEGGFGADLFARPTWSWPAPVPKAKANVVAVATPPAPPPAAPPPPRPTFTVIGKKLEAQVWEVFLLQGEQSYVLREGQTMESTWRIDRINPPTMLMTHLPTATEHTMPIGDER